MKIIEIYNMYHINKGLREHMLRVASVAHMICKTSEGKIDTNKLVSVCLLHDMGNIVKAKFELAPELFAPEGVAYYKKIQQEFSVKYGNDDYCVTKAILRELNVDGKLIDLFDSFGLTQMERIYTRGTIEEKIVTYSDLRVGFYGVVSIDDRHIDIVARYVPQRYSKEEVEGSRKYAHSFESEIFLHSTLMPSDIDDTAIAHTRTMLESWDIAMLQ